MRKLILLIGNVGTGKSTWVKNLKQRENRKIFVCDSIEPCPNGEDVIHSLMMSLQRGMTVIIDGNNITKKDREMYFQIAGKNTPAIAIDFGIGNEQTIKNRIESNTNKSSTEWTNIHLQKQQIYQFPDYAEGFTKIYKVRYY